MANGDPNTPPNPPNQPNQPGPGVPLTPPDPSATNPVPPMAGLGSLANLASQFLGQGGGGQGGLGGLANMLGVPQQPQFPNGQRPVNFRPDVPSPGPWRQPWTMPPIRSSGWGESNWMIDGNANYPGNDISPSMPSPMEALSIIGGAGRQLSQFGPPGPAAGYARASQLAMQLSPWLDMLSKGAFSKNYAAARLGLVRQKEEEMVLEAAQARQAHQQILQRYDDIISTFNAGGYGPGLEGEQRATDELIAAANAAPGGPDQHLIGVIQNSGLGAAHRYLQDQDQRMQAMWAAESSTTKSSKTGASDPYTGAEAGAGGDEGPIPPRAEIMHPPEPKPEGPAGPGPDVTTPGATDVMDASFKPGGKSGLGLNSSGIQLAHDLLNGSEQGDKKAAGYDKAHNAAMAMQKSITDIARNPNLTPEEKMARIKAIDSRFGDDIESLRTYKMDPKTPDLKARGLKLSIASMSDPHFKQEVYDQAKKYYDRSNPFGRAMGRIATLPKAGLNVLAALEPISERETIPMRYVETAEGAYITGSPKYTNLYQAINDMAVEVAGAQSGTGTARVTMIQNLLKHMSASNSPAQIRGQMKIDISNAYNAMESATDDWTAMTGLPPSTMPQYNKNSADVLEGIMHMNSDTGQVPDDAPPELKSTAKDGRERGYGIAKEQLAPLNRQQRIDGRAQYEKYKNDPRPEVQAAMKVLLRRLGIYRDIPRPEDKPSATDAGPPG